MKMRIPALALITIFLSSYSASFGRDFELDPNALVKRYMKYDEGSCGSFRSRDIGNGIETTDFKPVIQIEIDGSKAGKTFPHLCTGSLMKGGAKIFTAAHCLCLPKDEALESVWVDGEKVRAAEFILHPKAAEACRAGLPIPPEHDIAFLRVPLYGGSTKALVVNGDLLETLKQRGSYEIATDALKVGAELTVVGFGQHRLNGIDPSGSNFYDGKKRYGTNRIDKIEPDTQMIFCPGRTKASKNPEKLGIGVGVLFGDSGAPLLVDGKIYGVARQLDSSLFGTGSGYATVFNRSNSDFIRSTLANPDDRL